MFGRRTVIGASIGTASLALVAPTVQAAVPVKDYENQTWRSTTGRELTIDDVRQAIVRGAQAQQWETSYVDASTLRATLFVRNKHMVQVTISFTVGTFSIRYHHSMNMRPWRNHDGIIVIHPNYNVWVGELHTAVRGELERA